MPKAKNILFVMYDQLRWDYLSCAGHPHLQTPHFDWVASRGVQFSRCYVQSPICGSSRMSTYTGRYVSSHGASWNGVPLKVGEQTMGDHLRDVGMDCVLIGKTHMRADTEGMKRLGIAPHGIIGARVSECGFDMGLRDDGMSVHGPDGSYDDNESAYNKFLKSKGYSADNPWHDNANAGVDENLNVKSGFELINSSMPANVREEDSETPWLTGQMIEWLEQRYDKNSESSDTPWCVHLSFIKPHWPYIVPAPYHSMYTQDQVIPVVQGDGEYSDAHPVLKAFQNGAVGTTAASEEARKKYIPAYMGLVKQCDDQLGRLLDYLRDSGRLDDTIVVLTSDHGDYLGDHYLGEKGLWHDCSVKVPLIIMDPDEAADATRGTCCDELVEAIDLLPTFVDVQAGDGEAATRSHVLEGHSLLPLLRQNPGKKQSNTSSVWRDHAISEYDFSMVPIREVLGLTVDECRWYVIVDEQWKCVFFTGNFRPALYDLKNDPDELHDLGGSEEAKHIEVMQKMRERHHQWLTRVCQRASLSDEKIKGMTGKSARRGVVLGIYEANKEQEPLFEKYRGKVDKDFTTAD